MSEPTIKDLAAFLGLTKPTIQAWIDRGWYRTESSSVVSPGRCRLLNRNDTYVLAIAAVMRRSGLSAKKANLIARMASERPGWLEATGCPYGDPKYLIADVSNGNVAVSIADKPNFVSVVGLFCDLSSIVRVIDGFLQ